MEVPKAIEFVLIVWLFSWSTSSLSMNCPENERQALLKFKQGLLDPSNLLSSWVGPNCCKWRGVGCNNGTGHVVKLDLRNPFPLDVTQHFDDYDYMPYNKACLEVVDHQVTSSLLELIHLNYLDLSWNNFSGIEIPMFFGSFKELKYLNLSSAWFGGTVPHQLGNLSALHSLDLSLPIANFGNIPTLNLYNLQWVTNLFSLQHLDMSRLNLVISKSSRATSSLPSLLELRLAGCGLTEIPLTRENLTSLVVLDLSTNWLKGSLPKAILNMTSLEVLDLSTNQLSSNGPILDELKNLNQLKIIDLSANNFERKAIENSENSLSPLIRYNLESVYLSNNQLNGSLPDWLYQIKNMRNLDLSSNSFTGSIRTDFGSFSSLNELDLSSNSLNGSIPTSFGNLSTLEVLILGSNELSGSIPTSIGGLSALRVLDLSANQLSGQIPMSLGRLSSLTKLDLSLNQLTDKIPMSFGGLSNLTQLNLRSNQLNGTIPESLGQLSELTDLDLSSNSLNGVISDAIFAKLPKLVFLELSWNSLTVNMASGWIPPFQLQYIGMTSCNVGLRFPEWLRTQTQFTALSMSNASISDSIPNWFQNLSSQLSYLDLSNNQIYGTFPNLAKSNSDGLRLYLSSNRFSGSFPLFPPNVNVLDLSNNQIAGSIPQNIGDMLTGVLYLFLSSNHLNGSIPSSLCKMQYLGYLDLAKNNLSGDLPQCWSALQNLLVLDLASNSISGTIPTSIGHLLSLRTLRLSSNNFQGQITSALKYCTSLSILDLGENSLSGRIPTWIAEDLSSLEILRLRSNNLNGSIPTILCQLSFLQIMDLGRNNLSGNIPHCFGNFSTMISGQTNEESYLDQYTGKLTQVIKGRELEYTLTLSFLFNLDLSSNNLVGAIPQEITILSGLIGLNLSENHLTGNIPQKIGQMKSLESLDLSMNQLSGSIPESISALSSLSHLNLSYNNLSGPIPSGNQLQTFEDTSIYEGNPELCGPPIEKKCRGDEPSQTPAHAVSKDDDEGDNLEMSWFYIGMASGFFVGTLGVFSVLWFKKNWRYAYFQYAEDINDGFHVLKRTLKNNQAEN